VDDVVRLELQDALQKTLALQLQNYRAARLPPGRAVPV
jgi:hypothetical protein